MSLSELGDVDTPRPPADRTIRMWGEVCSTGMWGTDGFPIWTDDLPITPALAARIAAWADWYDTEDSRNDTGSPWEAHGGPIEAFDVEGVALARALSDELGAEWRIVYSYVAGWVDRHAPDDVGRVAFGRAE